MPCGVWASNNGPNSKYAVHNICYIPLCNWWFLCYFFRSAGFMCKNEHTESLQDHSIQFSPLSSQWLVCWPGDRVSRDSLTAAPEAVRRTWLANKKKAQTFCLLVSLYTHTTRGAVHVNVTQVDGGFNDLSLHHLSVVILGEAQQGSAQNEGCMICSSWSHLEVMNQVKVEASPPVFSQIVCQQVWRGGLQSPIKKPIWWMCLWAESGYIFFWTWFF